MNQPAEKVNLLNFDRPAMMHFFAGLGEKPFRAQQLLQWIHQQGETDFDKMSNLSLGLRKKLADVAHVVVPSLLSMQHASDGTRKYLFSSFQNSAIEAVYIPEKTRATLCISSQVGCVLNCKFCHTAQQGFQRNLTTAEIIGQLWYVFHHLKQTLNQEHPVTNVVFMGMGEPLLNYDNVLGAIRLMQDDLAYGLSKKRVTLSTSGVVPALQQFTQETDVALAVSLHAPEDTLRSQIMPINKKYPIKQLMAACKQWTQRHPKRKVTIEYVMLKGINDSPEQAKMLAKLLSHVPAKVNLIPFNPFSGTDFQCSDARTVATFQKILMQYGLITIVRKTRGEDIDAACGQLAGRVLDRTKRSQPYKSKRQTHLPVVVQPNNPI